LPALELQDSAGKNVQGVRRVKGRELAENCALLGYYAASSGIFLPTFRDNLFVPSSGFKNSKQSL
jgi:hypothetical protein